MRHEGIVGLILSSFRRDNIIGKGIFDGLMRVRDGYGLVSPGMEFLGDVVVGAG